MKFFSLWSVILFMLNYQISFSQSGINSIETGMTISLVRTASNGSDQFIVGSSHEGQIIAYQYDGTLVWNNSLSGFMNLDLWCEDITGDGVDEILAANADGTIYCLDNEGNLLWQFKANDAPMLSVCVIAHEGNQYVVCGGFDMSIYYLDASGALVKEIESSTYSQENSWGDDAPPDGIHIANFIRTIRQSDGTEDLVVHGCINTNSTNGSLYFFEAMADLPYSIGEPENVKPVGDVRVSKYFGDGLEKITLGSSTVHNSMDLSIYSPEVDQMDYSKLSNIKNDLGGHGYRVIQTEVIPKDNSYEYFTLAGQAIALIPPSLDLDNTETLVSNYAFNDMWHDEVNNRILLASSQSGGSAIHVIDYTNPNWKNAYVNISPPGKIQDILNNTQEVKNQLENFTKPNWERTQKPVYFVSDLSTNGIPSDVSNLVQDINNNYDSPILMGSKFMSKVQDPATWNRDTMSNAFYRDTRDGRKDYVLTKNAVLDLIVPHYNSFPGISTWGGHGNDPYMYSLDTKKAILDGAEGEKTVFIYPELQKDDENFEYVLKNLMYPLALYARPRNGQIHLRTKHIFWQGAAHRPLWSRLSSGEFADIFIPTMEETGDKSQDISVAGRMGFWMSGAVNEWGTRAVPDNSSFGRLRQFSTQRLPNHHLRQVIYALANGATHLNNFMVDREYTSLAWELVANGALFVPNKNEILSISPVHLSMTSEPDPYYLNEGTNAKWLTFFDEQREEDNKLVFSRLNATWMGSPVTDWDFSNYAANEKERRLNFIPSYNNGMVMITPVQEGALAINDVPRGKLTDHLHPFYKDIMKEYITDGRDYISSDGTQRYPAETYYTTIKSEIENAASLLPITVSGDVGWVVAQTDSLHLRLTIIDGGYVNPSKKSVSVNFHSIQPIVMTDLLSGETFDVSNGAPITVDIPCGLFRFLDIELEEKIQVAANEVTKEEMEFNIHPNPSDGRVLIEFFTSKKETNVQVFDVLGKRLQNLNLSSLPNENNSLLLNLSNEAKGLYYIVLDDTRVRKVIIH